MFRAGPTGGLQGRDCPGRMPEAACKWVHKDEGCTSLYLICQEGEVTVQQIADWFGFGGDKSKVSRIRIKLNALVGCRVLASYRNPAGRGEYLYQLGVIAPSIMPRCAARFQALREDLRQGVEEKRNQLARLVEKLRKMDAVGPLGNMPKG